MLKSTQALAMLAYTAAGMGHIDTSIRLPSYAIPTRWAPRAKNKGLAGDKMARKAAECRLGLRHK